MACVKDGLKVGINHWPRSDTTRGYRVWPREITDVVVRETQKQTARWERSSRPPPTILLGAVLEFADRPVEVAIY